MKLYDNAYPSNYDEIKTYYPVWYHDVLEMDALWRVMGEQLDEIQAGIAQSVDNCFVMTADEQTIKKLESFLRLSADPQKTLDERRRLVASYFVGFGKMSGEKIKEILRAFTNADSEVLLAPVESSTDQALFIAMQRGTTEILNIKDIEKTLNDRIPGHLMIVCTVVYNYGNLSKFTHAGLSGFTHGALTDGIPLKEVK